LGKPVDDLIDTVLAHILLPQALIRRYCQYIGLMRFFQPAA
jgi:hypothetical protein